MLCCGVCVCVRVCVMLCFRACVYVRACVCVYVLIGGGGAGGL